MIFVSISREYASSHFDQRGVLGYNIAGGAETFPDSGWVGGAIGTIEANSMGEWEVGGDMGAIDAGGSIVVGVGGGAIGELGVGGLVVGVVVDPLVVGDAA